MSRPRMIVKISAKTGWYVDKVTFHYGDCTSDSYSCESPKGTDEKVELLKANEYVIAVEQHFNGNSAQYLGNQLTFKLSSGRDLTFAGAHNKNKCGRLSTKHLEHSQRSLDGHDRPLFKVRNNKLYFADGSPNE